MTTFVFDVQGTLIGNPSVTDEDVRKMLLVLRARGHHLVILTSNVYDIPVVLREMVDEVMQKPVVYDTLDKDSIVFDDCMQLLNVAARHGLKVVHAHQMGDWIANQDWNDGSGRQDARA